MHTISARESREGRSHRRVEARVIAPPAGYVVGVVVLAGPGHARFEGPSRRERVEAHVPSLECEW